nr:MAG: hypothetical protein [Molluscum contagiosum virus]
MKALKRSVISRLTTGPVFWKSEYRSCASLSAKSSPVSCLHR